MSTPSQRSTNRNEPAPLRSSRCPKSASTPPLGVDKITIRAARRQPGKVEFDSEPPRSPGGQSAQLVVNVHDRAFGPQGQILGDGDGLAKSPAGAGELCGDAALDAPQGAVTPGEKVSLFGGRAGGDFVERGARIQKMIEQALVQVLVVNQRTGFGTASWIGKWAMVRLGPASQRGQQIHAHIAHVELVKLSAPIRRRNKPSLPLESDSSLCTSRLKSSITAANHGSVRPAAASNIDSASRRFRYTACRRWGE